VITLILILKSNEKYTKKIKNALTYNLKRLKNKNKGNIAILAEQLFYTEKYRVTYQPEIFSLIPEDTILKYLEKLYNATEIKRRKYFVISIFQPFILRYINVSQLAAKHFSDKNYNNFVRSLIVFIQSFAFKLQDHDPY
jgi:hypothetical protein